MSSATPSPSSALRCRVSGSGAGASAGSVQLRLQLLCLSCASAVPRPTSGTWCLQCLRALRIPLITTVRRTPLPAPQVLWAGAAPAGWCWTAPSAWPAPTCCRRCCGSGRTPGCGWGRRAGRRRRVPGGGQLQATRGSTPAPSAAATRRHAPSCYPPCPPPRPRQVEVLLITRTGWGSGRFLRDTVGAPPPREVHFAAYAPQQLEKVWRPASGGCGPASV